MLLEKHKLNMAKIQRKLFTWKLTSPLWCCGEAWQSGRAVGVGVGVEVGVERQASGVERRCWCWRWRCRSPLWRCAWGAGVGAGAGAWRLRWALALALALASALASAVGVGVGMGVGCGRGRGRGRGRGLVGVARLGVGYPGKTAPLRGGDSDQRKVAGPRRGLGREPAPEKGRTWLKGPWEEGSPVERASKGRSDERSPSSAFENSSFFFKKKKHPRRPKPRIQKVRHLIRCTVEFDRNSFHRCKRPIHRGGGRGEGGRIVVVVRTWDVNGRTLSCNRRWAPNSRGHDPEIMAPRPCTFVQGPENYPAPQLTAAKLPRLDDSCRGSTTTAVPRAQ